MASWAEQLRHEWDREDERRRKQRACPACGRHDHIVLIVEAGVARVRCRCGHDFAIRS